MARFLGWDESKVRPYSVRSTSREGAVDQNFIEMFSPNGLRVSVGLDTQTVYVDGSGEKGHFTLGHLKVDKVALRTVPRRVKTFKRMEFLGEDKLEVEHDSLIRANINGRQIVWAL